MSDSHLTQLRQRLEATLRSLLPLSADTEIELEEVPLPTGEIETRLYLKGPQRPDLHYHLPKALAEISEEDLVRVLVYREGGGCSHPHGEN